MPGWDENSVGYHSDDGKIFFSKGKGDDYGPKFGEGDIVGLCLDTVNSRLFYTLNGKKLDYKQYNYKEELYPTVNFRNQGSVIRINLGSDAFLFDFENYRDGVLGQIRNEIKGTPKASNKQASFSFTDYLFKNNDDSYSDINNQLVDEFMFSNYALCRNTPVNSESKHITKLKKIYNRFLCKRLVTIRQIKKIFTLVRLRFPRILWPGLRIIMKAITIIYSNRPIESGFLIRSMITLRQKILKFKLTRIRDESRFNIKHFTQIKHNLINISNQLNESLKSLLMLKGSIIDNDLFEFAQQCTSKILKQAINNELISKASEKELQGSYSISSNLELLYQHHQKIIQLFHDGSYEGSCGFLQFFSKVDQTSLSKGLFYNSMQNSEKK